MSTAPSSPSGSTGPAAPSPLESGAAGGDPWSEQKSARILVVDDEKVIREILCEFLAMEGFVVRGVEDGEKALTELRLRPYDLLITDLKMPRLSGLQLLEKIEAERLDRSGRPL
ncbi:MAG TPA: response regulator, partial [Kofleriaceae bacterium]